MKREDEERIAMQAKNIQVIEAEFLSSDSDGNPIPGTEHIATIIYNLENISEEEVCQLMYNDRFRFDSRILVTDPDRLAHIFPHRGEIKSDKDFIAYWKSREDKEDRLNCECSSCGFIVPVRDAMEFNYGTKDWTILKYCFCPKCGEKMTGFKKNKRSK